MTIRAKPKNGSIMAQYQVLRAHRDKSDSAAIKKLETEIAQEFCTHAHGLTSPLHDARPTHELDFSEETGQLNGIRLVECLHTMDLVETRDDLHLLVTQRGEHGARGYITKLDFGYEPRRAIQVQCEPNRHVK